MGYVDCQSLSYVLPDGRVAPIAPISRPRCCSAPAPKTTRDGKAV